MDERPDYQPRAPQEQFIVPLLREHIELALTKHASPSHIKSNVLDIGCGRQPFRKRLEGLGYSYTSMDTQQTEDRIVDFVGAIDEALPGELLSAGPFDLLFCTEVMEHVAIWDVAFRNFADLLAPDGKLLITCPHFYQLHEVPYDFWRPTPYALEYFARRVGLDVVDQTSAGTAWDVIGTVLANSSAVSVKKTFRNRLTRKFIEHGQRWLFHQLKNGHLQEKVALEGPIYQANIAVFQRK